MSSGKRLGEGPRVRRLAGNRPGATLDERLASAGQGCPNRPPCRHGNGLHEDGMCTALNCYCGHSFRAPPGPASRSECWMQAYTETAALPSWERGEAHRRRYEDLVTSHGLLLR